MRVTTSGERVCGNADRRRRRTEVDDERPLTAETRRFLDWLEQIVNAQVPDLAGHWRIYRRCHKSLPKNGTRAQDIDEASTMKA
jgi:hypothetical protein